MKLQRSSLRRRSSAHGGGSDDKLKVSLTGLKTVTIQITTTITKSGLKYQYIKKVLILIF